MKKNTSKIVGLITLLGVGSLAVGLLTPLAIGQIKDSHAQTVAAAKELVAEIEQEAKKEGMLNSVGMPDTKLNWGETWADLGQMHSLTHLDTNLHSGEVLTQFQIDGENATADIGDVGLSFGALAASKELTLPYKTTYWDEIPNWAKDDDGDWLLSYTGTMAFITDKENVQDVPKTWGALAKGDYCVSVGDVTTSNQAQYAVLAAAMANGGDETVSRLGIEYFKRIAAQDRLSTVDPSLENLAAGKIDVAIIWDFNALNYREQIDKDRFEVCIPKEGSVTSGYTTVINKYAQHPNAAKLAREYILSDEGQINLAKSYARPIREIALPAEVKAKLLPDEQYEAVEPVNDQVAWNETALELPEIWETEVLGQTP
ncbi:MAG: ABC transporter substrate-binding protein [Enterococcus sp.]